MLDICARFETVPRTDPVEVMLQLGERTVSARELITQYVRSAQGSAQSMLVQPTKTERELNDRSAVPERTESRIQQALSAFDRNGFILLVDDRQVADLDEEITLAETSTVTFLRLTPLVGG